MVEGRHHSNHLTLTVLRVRKNSHMPLPCAGCPTDALHEACVLVLELTRCVRSLPGWTDVHRVALRKLDEAIFGGNPETVNAVAAQMGDQDGAEVLALFQAGFVKSRGARWKTRRILDHVDMFFAVYDAMGRYLDEDKVSGNKSG